MESNEIDMDNKLIISFNEPSSEENEVFVKQLKEYQLLIGSTIGPFNSRYKFVATKSDPTSPVITNSSKHLVNSLYRTENATGFTKWRLDVIKTCLESSHFAHCFDSGLFLTHLVNAVLIKSQSLSHSHRHFFDSAFKCLAEKLTNDKKSIETSPFLVNLDLSNLKFLQSLLRTVLFSNKLLDDCFQTDVESARFINMLLKLHLSSFNQSPDEADKFVFARNMYLFNEDSARHLNDSLLFEGVLVKRSQFQIESEINSNFRSKSRFTSVIFDTNSLGGDFEALSDSGLKFEADFAQLDLERRHFLPISRLKTDFDKLIDKFSIDLVMSQKVRKSFL